MEIPFLEIPESHFPLAKSGVEDDGLDLFDVSYLLGLTETARAQTGVEKYIVFKLERETFGVPLQNVMEVCRSLPVTSLPNVPQWVAGIANLRGSLLTVIDLRAGEERTAASKTKLIVLTDRQKQHFIGLTVDQIVEITALLPENIAAAPPARNFGAGSFITGKAIYTDSDLFVFDTEKLFSSAQLNDLRKH